MTDHICRNCRWWAQVGWAVHTMGKDCGVCELASVFAGRAEHPKSKATANGYGGPNEPRTGPDWARLATKADFGCVQWEGKE